MDFTSMTTDDLRAAIPPAEDDRWELKSALFLERQSRGELKRELAKQVSAFANSGGGYLVFGASNTGQLEPCEQSVGRQSMKDFLAALVEQSVEYPIRHFRVHRIPFTDDPENSVFVIDIEDSPAAPHQAKEERIYFYRIDGHSKPAPHFHVELLRNRLTRAVLQVIETDYILQTPEPRGNSPRLTIALKVVVENQSLQCATNWGVHIKHCRGDYRWTVGRDQVSLAEGACIHGEQPVLLPSEKAPVTVHIRGEDPSCIGMSVSGFVRLWEDFGVDIRPVSQNHVGKKVFYGWQGPVQWIAAKRRLKQELARFGIAAS